MTWGHLLSMGLGMAPGALLGYIVGYAKGEHDAQASTKPVPMPPLPKQLQLPKTLGNVPVGSGNGPVIILMGPRGQMQPVRLKRRLQTWDQVLAEAAALRRRGTKKKASWESPVARALASKASRRKGKG